MLEYIFSSVCQTLSLSHSWHQRIIGVEETSKKPSIVFLHSKPGSTMCMSFPADLILPNMETLPHL